MASVFIQPNYIVIAKDLVLVIEVSFFEKNRCFFELPPQFCFTNAFYLSLRTFVFERGVNRRTDRRILQIFLPGFRIQSEILTDFRILQLQRNADSSIFWSRILDSACNINIFARISDSW